MEQINMTKYLPCTTRLVGGTLYILDGEGRVQRRLDPLQTAIEWFQMSNDAFYARYGVNWIPKEPYYSQARRWCIREMAAMREVIRGCAPAVMQPPARLGRGRSQARKMQRAEF